MADLPRGTVTFLFTDIEGSTALLGAGPGGDGGGGRAPSDALTGSHRTRTRACSSRSSAMRCRRPFPRLPMRSPRPLTRSESLVTGGLASERTDPLRVRMALHTAAATPQDGDYLAPGLNRLSRLLAAAHGGQVLLSLATQDLARDALPPEASLRDLGEHPLRDLYRPERVFQLLHPDLPADFPPDPDAGHAPQQLALATDPLSGAGGPGCSDR